MKRTISFLLSLAMIITMLPAGAFAAELETTPVVETQAVTEAPTEQETEAAETTAAETEPVETTAVETEPTEIPEETTAPTEETVPEPTEAVVEETTEIAAEETEEAAAEQTMSFKEFKAMLATGDAWVNAKVIIEEDLVVDTRLNIYSGGEIIVPSGVTLTLGQYQEIWISGGKLIVEQGGSLVNNAYVMVEAGGALDVRGSFSMGASGLISLIWHNGEVINGVDHSQIHAQGNVYTEEELRAMLGQTDYKTVIVSLHESVRLSSDLYIAENMRLMMDGDPELGEGPELIVPSGVTLTVDGELNMFGAGITVEPGGTLRVNESAWVQMYYGYIHAEGATVETAVGRIHMHFDGYSEILGVDTSLVNGTCKVENMDDLWKAVGLCSLYNFVEIEPYTTITVESDLTIPGNAMFAMYDQDELMQLIIPDGVTVISYADVIINDNCQIWIQEGGTLELCGGINDYTGCGFIVDGTLIDNSPGEGGGGSYGGVTTFEELKAAIEAGSGDIDINGSITVTENLMVPENRYVFINYDSELIIPSGVSFTTYSGMSIFGGKLTVENGGAFTVAAMYINGTFTVHPGATFTLLETGNMTVRYGDEAVVIGVPQNSYTLEYYAENEADIRSGLAITGYQWVAVHLFADVTLASNLTIPESTSLIIDTRWNENGSDGGTLTIPKGKTVTNNGYLTAGSPEGRLVIDKGGKVINNSDLMNYGYLVNNGEIVNNGGCYFQGEISGDGIITGNGYVSYTGHAYSYTELVDLLSGNRVPTQINIWGEVTLEGDVTIPEGTRLNLDGEGNTLIVPDGVTLTVKGELLVQYGGVATFEKGSKLINVYEVMAFHGGTINIYGTYVRENPDANLALYAEGIINGVANSSIHYADSFADEASLQAILNKVKTEGYGQVTVYIQYDCGQVEITGDVTIPEGGYLLIGSDSLMLKPGATLTNNGEIHVYSPAQLIVDSGAELIDNGKIYAEEGCIIYLGGGIALSADAQQILGKGKANITAALTPASSAKITWTLAEGDELYATLKGSGSKAVLTAADVTGKKTVKVIASAKLANGAEVSDTIEITIVPLTKQIALLSGGKDVTGQTITHDLASQNVTLSMDLTAVVAPGDAGTALTWTSSDEAIATVKDGKVSFTAREGQVTITASATDGSKVSAKVTIDAVYLIQGLELKEGASELVGGNGTQLKVIDSLAPGKELGRGDVIWTLAKEADAAYVSVTPDGKVTTKAVPEKITVKLLCSVAANPEAKALEHTITIYPAVAQVDLVDGDEIYTGRTIKLSRGGVIILQAKQYPVDSMEGVTWEISDKDGKFVEILSSEGETLILKSTGVKGNVTVKITAADGSKKSASVKIQTGTYVEKVTVTSPVIDLVSGEKVQLTATPYPADADNTAVVWSLEDPNDKQYVSVSSSGLVSAKKGLSMSKPITVVATAKDGCGAFGSFALQLQPADPGALVILAEDNANVTGTTIDVDLLAGGSIKLKAKYFNTDSADVTWSGKNVIFSAADAAGYVTATVSGKGNFTVTAEDGSGKKASVKLKAANLSEMIQISGPTAVSSGKSIQLTATVLPQGKVADKKVTWWIDPVHTQYATISSSGKLTATKNLTDARNISVWAQAKDGNSEPEMFCVDILPLAQSVQILESGVDVTNTNYVWDLAVDEGNPVITAEVLAADASQAVVWKLSGAKVLQQNADGTFSVTGKAGTATITVTAADGSGKKASFKFTVVKSMEYIQQAQTEAVIAGGKSLKLASFVTVDKTATNQKLVWSMSGDTEVATLNATGVLKTKKVTAVHTITVTATAADGSGRQAEFTVYVYPATTSVKLLCDGSAAPKQATLGIGGTMTLEGISLPSAAAQGPGAYTWKLSSDKFAEIQENADGTVTITGKAAGTVTVTCTAADGTGKKATLKIKIG